MIKFNVNGEEFTFRKYKKGDEKELLPMMNGIFKYNMDKDYWDWKYKQCPAGFFTIVALNKEKKIIGQMCHQFKKGFYYGKEYPFLMTVDVVIKEEYRRLGIINQLRLFYPDKPFLHYGFPNDRALNAYKKLDNYYQYASEIYILHKNYNLFDKLKSISNKGVKSNTIGISIASLNNVDEINNFWMKKKAELNVCVIRDWEYLNWRILIINISRRL